MAERLFFALPVSISNQMALIKHQAHLGQLGRVVPATNFHLTLAFLGQVTQKQKEGLIDRWQELEVPRLSLTLDRYLHFPKAGVVCLGCDQSPIALNRLAGQLRRDAAQHGLHSHRAPFRPHVTLFRGVHEVTELPEPAPVTLELNEVQLMRSHREMGKLVYSPLVRWHAR
ncbi:RNA 2',3'-cyclic phosphodiesterase [Ferrimonas sp. YFM]|uniref:RNA 2',3'-cyclic phosphodiesterase n=1 Tax=Ferrimonas sp. YFM TaxID=3028878 RepID=UPI002572A531|nr:RNA 2',3'-cyclic phosphodiesterase [Ferrimonas sp. YFM]BDY06425.1 RNA 2',3'-cyclic phosphodiesterase [Ferrimonas sp. YFM]